MSTPPSTDESEANNANNITALEALMITNAQQALDAVTEILEKDPDKTNTRQTMAMTANYSVIAAFAMLATTPENGMTESAQALLNSIHDRCLAAMHAAGDTSPAG